MRSCVVRPLNRVPAKGLSDSDMYSPVEPPSREVGDDQCRAPQISGVAPFSGFFDGTNLS